MPSKRRKRPGPPPRPAPRSHRPRRTTGPATRAQQQAAAAQRKKQARRRQVVIALLVLAAVAAVAAYVVTSRRADDPLRQALPVVTCEQRHDGAVIVAGREGMPTPVAATAGGQRLLCGEVEPEVVDRFAEEHVGNGPEDVERGSP